MSSAVVFNSVSFAILAACASVKSSVVTLAFLAAQNNIHVRPFAKTKAEHIAMTLQKQNSAAQHTKVWVQQQMSNIMSVEAKNVHARKAASPVVSANQLIERCRLCPDTVSARSPVISCAYIPNEANHTYTS